MSHSAASGSFSVRETSVRSPSPGSQPSFASAVCAVTAGRSSPQRVTVWRTTQASGSSAPRSVIALSTRPSKRIAAIVRALSRLPVSPCPAGISGRTKTSSTNAPSYTSSHASRYRPP